MNDPEFTRHASCGPVLTVWIPRDTRVAGGKMDSMAHVILAFPAYEDIRGDLDMARRRLTGGWLSNLRKWSNEGKGGVNKYFYSWPKRQSCRRHIGLM